MKVSFRWLGAASLLSVATTSLLPSPAIAAGGAFFVAAALGGSAQLLALAYARPRILLLGGAGSLLSYGIALWAMTRAPVATVAALRETSILFATIIAAFFLREKINRRRVAAVLLVASGATLMRLG